MTQKGLDDVSGLELAVEADDEETFNEAVAELNTLEEKLAQLEFRRMFSGSTITPIAISILGRFRWY